MGHKLLLLPPLALLLLSGSAQAQVSVNVQLGIPVPVSPPLVVVQPGVQVVHDCDHEIFYHHRSWWLREDGRWYRARDRRAGWVVVENRAVPVALYRLPPGQYRHWRKAERKEERREAKHERQEWKHGHGEGHGEGHGHGRWRD